MCDQPKCVETDRLLTIGDAARMLSCSPRQIWRFAGSKRPEPDRLRLVRLDGLTRVSMHDLLEFIESRKR
jgi:hypothetical protein